MINERFCWCINCIYERNTNDYWECNPFGRQWHCLFAPRANGGKENFFLFFFYILNFSFLCASLSLKTSSSCCVSYLFKCIFELWFFTFLTFLLLLFLIIFFSCFLLIFSLFSFTPRVCNFFLLYSFSLTLSLGSL